METKPWAIATVLLCTLLISVAQIFYKLSVKTLDFNLISAITNINLLIGIALYGIGGILLVLSFKGGEVSVLYPIIATGYIWVSFLSKYFLNEEMNYYKWSGVFIIALGIMIIGLGSKKNKKISLSEVQNVS
ncbi:hypothetical protein HYX01_02520 [Candidatus Woesearchaeota archaeon]|nr:hypothetical protein [Candidatus Woesearchaeota archaeon]